ncbi:MAG: hypothetical protein A3I04_08050 [Nitrospinae bacterium RIFCSPLOWO2_02_FULL_39_110]|nr:MAG: hypothetical protein A3I04_08050 [Nitrospinae bacterium RIFCSPLOWO2_02_FULL_39_110]
MLEVAVIFKVPVLLFAVRVTLATPLEVVAVVTDNVPMDESFIENVTLVPSETEFPEESFTVAVMLATP